MAMYDEIERAVTGGPRRGMSPLAWIAVAFVGFSVLGLLGAAASFLVVRHEVKQVVHRIEEDITTIQARGVSDAVAAVVAGALAGIEPDLLADDPETGRLLLQNLQAGDLDAADIQEIVDGSLRIRTREGDVTADLRGGEHGGQLVIRSPEGETRFELTRSDRGGELVIRSEGETVRFGAGEVAGGAPGWLPRPASMPDAARPLMSARSGQGVFGALAWQTEGSPEALVRAYRERLEDEGYTLRSEITLVTGGGRGEGRAGASVVGRDDDSGRTVFLVATPGEAGTRVLLGYGEGTGR